MITMPCDDLLEAKTLGAALNSINAANDIYSELNENDFYNPCHRLIFSEGRNAYIENASLDFHWILRSLGTKNKIQEAGGVEYLTKLGFYWGNAGDWESYIEELKNLTSLRSLIYLSQEIPMECNKQGAKGEDLNAEIQSRLFKMQNKDSTSLKTYQEVMERVSAHGNFDDTMKWMVGQALKGEKPFQGIGSGYEILDDVLGYFRPGAIYYVGARTSMGKTTFLLNLMNNMLNNDICVGMFSLEMPAVQITLKLTCLRAGIKFSKFEEGHLDPYELQHLSTTCHELKSVPLILEEQPALTVNQVRSRAKRMLVNHGIKILFIDYLTLIKGNSKLPNKHMQVDEVSKALQSLAKELSIPIVCLAQLNRNVTTTSDKTPTLSDFRESGSIEEDADACILLHRPDYYDPNDKPGQIQVIVAKNRIRGILKKIGFSKDTNSEKYSEYKDLGSEVRRVNSENTREGYRSPYDN